MNRSSSDWPIARALVGAHAPHPPLERADGLLARLVDELLLGVLRLPLLGRVLANPRVHLGLEIRRELRVLVDHVLKVGREVDLAGAGRGNASNASGGSVDAPCWTAPARPYSVAREARQLLERLQIDLDVGPDGAVGVDEAAVRRAGLHADLAEPDETRRRAPSASRLKPFM